MPSSDVEVTVTVDRAYSARLDDVVRALESEGLTDVACHRRFLVVNGSIAAQRVDGLRKVDGVSSVRESRSYRASS